MVREERTARYEPVVPRCGEQDTAALFAAAFAASVILHQLWWGGFAGWSWHGAAVLAAAWCLLQPRSVRRLAALAAVEATSVVHDLPDPGSHTLLVLVTSLSVLAWCVARGRAARRWPERAELWTALRPFLRAQLLLVYGAAALAKLNGGFLDASVSCAAGLSARVTWWDPTLLGDWRVTPAIYGSLAVELTLPCLLAWPRTRTLALLLGCGFHAVLALGGNVPFSAVVLALYVAFLPPPRRRVLPAAGLSRGGQVAVLALLAGLWWLAAERHVAPGSRPGAVGDLTRLLVVAEAAVLAWLALRERVPALTAVAGRGLHPAFAAGLALLVLNAACPYLGLKTESSLTMFSNLQTEPGHWNHLLVPEAVRVFGAQDHLVAIERTDDPSLERRRAAGTLMVAFELERYLRAHPASHASWTGHAWTSGSALPRAALADRLVNFQDVRPGARGRC